MGGSLSRDFPARIGGHTAGPGYGNVLGNSGYLTIRPFEEFAFEHRYHFDRHENTVRVNSTIVHNIICTSRDNS
jgi:hypothetical protein